MIRSGLALKIFCKNSQSLGGSSGTLLNKIEELPLCVIDLKKENEKLRKMIESVSN